MADSTHGNGREHPRERINAPFGVSYVHRLRFTADVLHLGNRVLAELIESDFRTPARCLICVDSGVAAAWPDLTDQIETYFEAHEDRLTLAGPFQVVPGGEQCKNDLASFEQVTRAIHEAGICRRSYVIAIGGGAVLDAVGFAASAAHRGVRLVRLPTTTLAQADSGLGVKNGINAFGKKNFLGVFDPPWAVINDERFLTTLTDRDWRCGLSEAVKVALIKDRGFFDCIVAAAPALRARDHEALMPIIRRSAELHLRHIVEGGDPFERTTARPLDFGHWAAHKLEQMTAYDLRHGEAVAIGIALDTIYSTLTGHLTAPERDEVLACLRSLGFELHHDSMASTAVLLDGIEEFREHLGGRLTIPLLEGIGSQFDAHDIDEELMRTAVAELAAVTAASRT